MPFPVLHAHQIYPRFFQLSGGLIPVSIRDQMVRGQMLVNQALEAGLITRPSSTSTTASPLLVVGAGAAGATVALHAASQGVPTWLVERHPAPFTLQASCSTRWIDPCQYDWPFDHWHTPHHPWHTGGQPPPLSWNANWANQLANTWENQLRQLAQPERYPLRLLCGITAMAPQHNLFHRFTDRLLRRKGGWRMRFTLTQDEARDDPAELPKRFGMVVWTVGFGQETHMLRPDRMPLPTFSGFPFWADDPYQEPGYGLLPGITPRVVISGAGDGALQDFLRIMTRPEYKAVGDIAQALPLPEAVIRQLKSAEHRAQRAYHWGGNGAYDHAVLRTLHHEHLALAQHLAGQQQMRDCLRQVLRDNLPHTIHLVHSCDHFPHVYALNRFLVLLIAAYLQRNDLILAGKRTLDVVADGGHRCRVDQNGHGYMLCHGKDHVVHLVDAPYCAAPRERATQPIQSIPANIVIVRHGIDRQALPQPQLPDISMPRQLPPYHVHG